MRYTPAENNYIRIYPHNHQIKDTDYILSTIAWDVSLSYCTSTLSFYTNALTFCTDYSVSLSRKDIAPGGGGGRLYYILTTERRRGFIR